MEDYEKKYKEALEKANSALKDGGISSNTIAYIQSVFPELKESDDKRIMKKIVAALSYYRNEGCMSQTECNECKFWLEKQGNSNSQNWKPSKEQINALEHFVRSIAESGYASPYDDNTKLLKSLINDLHKLEKQKDTNALIQEASEKAYTEGMRVERKHWLEKQGNQKPAEWSEEDERLLSKLQIYVDLDCFDREWNGQDLINWLKSLRHQNTWKPSEEQMKYLHKYAEQNNYDGTILTGLYNDLKQLKQY